MKTKTLQTRLITALMLLGFLFLGNFVRAQSKPLYAYIYVPSVYTSNDTAYVTRIIYYDGQDKCGKDAYSFGQATMEAFSDYLKLHHTKDFLPSEKMIGKNFVGTNLFKTRGQAETDRDETLADEKDKGNKIVYTNFSFSCGNL